MAPLVAEIRPCGIGRACVRFMMRSMSESQTQLKAPAEAAASAPAISVQQRSGSDGMPRAAMTIEAAVVIKSKTMIRGFESS